LNSELTLLASTFTYTPRCKLNDSLLACRSSSTEQVQYSFLIAMLNSYVQSDMDWTTLNEHSHLW